MLDEDHSSTLDEVLEKALSLGVEDRAFLAEALQDSLKPADFATPEIAAAWAAEIERRARACERGEMPAEDWRIVMARLRENASRRHS
jgi:putative addiction module component (TIGR02574 family)